MTSQNESGPPADEPDREPEPPEASEAPESSEQTVDAEAEAARERAVFDELVAAFHSESAPDPVPRWPVIEDVADGPDGSDAADAAKYAAEAPAAPSTPSLKITRTQRDLVYRDFSIVEPTDETTVDKYFPDEHFEPEEPPPVPEADWASKASWTLLVGGVLFLLTKTLLQLDTDPWMFWVAVGSVVGGFVSLIARMRPDRDDDDGSDNGAVV